MSREFALVIGLLILLLVQPIAAQTETVDLQVKLARGETLYHTVSVTVQLSTDVAGTRSSVEVRSEGQHDDPQPWRGPVLDLR